MQEGDVVLCRQRAGEGEYEEQDVLHGSLLFPLMLLAMVMVLALCDL
jgi:hypothetical protein